MPLEAFVSRLTRLSYSPRRSWRSSSQPQVRPRAKAPNILWLDCRGYGPGASVLRHGARCTTPTIDRLAHQGMRFTRAFTTAPVCSASRSAFITGMYQTRIGAHNHRSHRDDGFAARGGRDHQPADAEGRIFHGQRADIPRRRRLRGHRQERLELPDRRRAFRQRPLEDLKRRTSHFTRK